MTPNINVNQNIRPRPSQRAVVAIPAETTRAANTWAGAYLPGYHLNELEKGLEAVMKHPDQASRGYSKAKDARTRLQFEINRRKALPPTV